MVGYVDMERIDMNLQKCAKIKFGSWYANATTAEIRAMLLIVALEYGPV